MPTVAKVLVGHPCDIGARDLPHIGVMEVILEIGDDNDSVIQVAFPVIIERVHKITSKVMVKIIVVLLGFQLGAFRFHPGLQPVLHPFFFLGNLQHHIVLKIKNCSREVHHRGVDAEVPIRVIYRPIAPLLHRSLLVAKLIVHFQGDGRFSGLQESVSGEISHDAVLVVIRHTAFFQQATVRYFIFPTRIIALVTGNDQSRGPTYLGKQRVVVFGFETFFKPNIHQNVLVFNTISFYSLKKSEQFLPVGDYIISLIKFLGGNGHQLAVTADINETYRIRLFNRLLIEKSVQKMEHPCCLI